MGDAFPILTDPCLGLSTEYPWAMTIATSASLFTFTLEWVLHKTFHQRLMHDADSSTQVQNKADAEAGISASAATSSDDIEKAYDRKARLKALQNVVVSYTFEAGIIFHSKCLLDLCIAPVQFAAPCCILNAWPGLTFVNNIFSLLQASSLELLWAYRAMQTQYERS